MKESTQETRIHGLSADTGDVVPLIEGSTVQKLAKECPWQFGQIEFNSTEAFENPPLICLTTTVAICSTENPVRSEFDFNGHVRRATFYDKSLSIIPIGDVGRWRCRDAHKTLMVAINNNLLNDIAMNSRMSENFQIPFIAPTPDDDFIKATLTVLGAEARSGFRSGRIYGDSLVTALATHLLCKYSIADQKMVDLKGGMGVNILQRTIEYIEENFKRDVSLNELSLLAAMSPHHFCRLFKHSTGITPHQYLIRCRVKCARGLLLNPKTSNLSMKQVASEVGFWDASHLTRHFKRFYGFNPSQLQ